MKSLNIFAKDGSSIYKEYKSEDISIHYEEDTIKFNMLEEGKYVQIVVNKNIFGFYVMSDI